MPVGGKLVLKGGLQVTSSGVEKKKKKKRKDKESSAGDDTGMARLGRGGREKRQGPGASLLSGLARTPRCSQGSGSHHDAGRGHL